ncbi:iron ABC transporter substrate-binding protein, partial [Hungatella sp. SL.1.14]|nr:iron ABC transporter substrate-binding protein [Hungatella sp. SL.1.14]
MALTMTAAALAGCSSSSSAPATTAAPKREAGSEASGDTLAAGSEEKKGGGKLVVYSPNSEGVMNATIPLFEEKYGVDVEVIQAGTGELDKRIQSEKNDP